MSQKIDLNKDLNEDLDKDKELTPETENKTDGSGGEGEVKEGEKADSDGKVELSKHKQAGKHSLEHDSIFKGKKEDPLDEETDFGGTIFVNETFEIDKSTQFYHETANNEGYMREKEIKQKVYEILIDHTEINFLNNRRKPSRADFNHYFFLLKSNLEKETFSNIELFNELAYYFSDNLFNMFKLLDSKWRNLIIDELQEHIGKVDKKTIKEIVPKNLTDGAEIEFLWIDPYTDEERFITGVIEESDHDADEYKINSYEHYYIVCRDEISRILNNTKFKYNLNKLNNIDFL